MGGNDRAVISIFEVKKWLKLCTLQTCILTEKQRAYPPKKRVKARGIQRNI
ncbi:MAG: hypothetical protein L6V93_15660 [Clostridiales bacterium]|nr:MAG: hypothetical protein L6V93_15660 [Clostridiales bacterium]